ncbi:MAG: hypothetical protein ACI308_06705 [Muribaculaceae bacterium]
MKKIALPILILLSAMFVGACTGNKNENDSQSVSTEQYDSLRTALAEKDSLMAFFAEISEGMSRIKDMENILNNTNLISESPNRKTQILSDMALIQQALADRRQRLEALEAKLKRSSNYSAEMQKTIDQLKQQISEQEETIRSLNQQLEAAQLRIDQLNTSVDSLKIENESVTSEKIAAQAESQRLTNELNTCYYVIGSKKELKDNKIIESGFLRKTKVMESDYELSYFTRADKRTLNELPLHSNKAKVMSKHPADSYQIVEKGNSKTLVITNSTKFWELSNFLIVQVN